MCVHVSVCACLPISLEEEEPDGEKMWGLWFNQDQITLTCNHFISEQNDLYHCQLLCSLLLLNHVKTAETNAAFLQWFCEFASLLGGLAVYIILSVLWYHIEFLVFALSSSVYPDAGPVWSLPLHGSVFPARNSGTMGFSQAASSLCELTFLTRESSFPREPEASSWGTIS